MRIRERNWRLHRDREAARGKILGRPPIDAEKEAAISADLRLGKAGIMKVAAAHGVGVGTVQRIKVALADYSGPL